MSTRIPGAPIGKMGNTVISARRDAGFWGLQIPGWLLVIYLIYSQAIPAFDYDLGVSMGSQEPASEVTEVGVAFWRGFAIADVAIYIPLLIIGLVGHFRQKNWGRITAIPLVLSSVLFFGLDPRWSLAPRRRGLE